MIKTRLILAFMVLMWALPLEAASHREMNDLLREGHRALSAWQIEEAEQIALKVEKEASGRVLAHYFLARYYFRAGQYVEALEHLQQAGGPIPKEKGGIGFEPFLAAAYENVKDFKVKKSEHFELRYPEGAEEILVEYAFETLEKAFAELSRDFDYVPEKRIPVEIFPDLSMLARATGLSMEALKTTGTIAICKFDRLLISSPRVSLMGYSWRDTINHELVHLFVSRVSQNQTPVWLHEGFAKLEELRWRRGPGGYLSASYQNLLARALRENTYVSLDEMHPSMALLPSQEHAALGYAEVLSMAQYLHRLKGFSGLRQLLKEIGKHGNLEKAFKTVYNFGLEGLQANWKRQLRMSGIREIPDLYADYKLVFDKEGEQDEEYDLKSIERKRARNYMTLGKLLKDRQHSRGALKEYQKATNIVGNGNLLLQNRLAQTYLEENMPQQAAQALDRVVKLHPGFVGTHIRMARALLELENPDSALGHLIIAVGINPFDPRVWKMMADAYDKLDLPDKRKLAEDNLRQLAKR